MSPVTPNSLSAEICLCSDSKASPWQLSGGHYSGRSFYFFSIYLKSFEMVISFLFFFSPHEGVLAWGEKKKRGHPFIAFRENGRKREKQWCERETSIGCLLWVAGGGLNLPLWCAPQQGSHPTSFWLWEDASTNWATPARAHSSLTDLSVFWGLLSLS